MKTEFVDVNDTRKNVHVEIPSDVVDAEIERLARDYSRKARVPGFRPGKVPPRVIKQRYRDQILHDLAHDLIPRAVDDALRERGVEPVDTPDIRDVTLEAGRPLTFTASFDTVPSFDPGDFSEITLHRRSGKVEDEAVDGALERLRQRAARFEPVEGRAVEAGDTVVADLERRQGGGLIITESPEPPPPVPPETFENVSVDLGAPSNPPGFDEHLLGLEPGAVTTFTSHYPADYAVTELADKDVTYTATVKSIKRRVVPALDDELAKDIGEFDTLDALRTRVRKDLEHEAKHDVEREVRSELMKQLAARVPFEVPASLVDREIDRRIEEFARRLMDQQIDPRQAGVDWNAFRESQTGAAREAVGAALCLDEVARREHIEVTPEEIESDIARYAERTGRNSASVRARLEKEGGLSRIAAGLRRDKSIDFVMGRAKIMDA